MAKIGYIRVSTEEQNTARQELQLQNLDKIYLEKISGKSAAARPELKKMMEYVREGDCVVVESISRFARNTKDLLSLVGECMAASVRRYSDGWIYSYICRRALHKLCYSFLC